MKLMERMKQRRPNNKGFSLVELIIVIAIMAVLIGIVGTQVVPYLNEAREAKDMQILNSFSTAAVTYYSLNSEKFVDTTTNVVKGVEIKFDGTGYNCTTTDTGVDNPGYIGTLTGYDTLDDLKNAKVMSSSAGRKITEIYIGINPASGLLSVNTESAPPGAVVVTASDGSGKLLDTVTSCIGKQQ